MGWAYQTQESLFYIYMFGYIKFINHLKLWFNKDYYITKSVQFETN